MTHDLKHRFGKIASLALIGMPVVSPQADVIQVNTGVSSSHFVDGLNVTNENPIAFIGVDWSLENGGFSGGECYQSRSENSSLSQGCHLYLGYFTPISDTQAVTFELRYKNYQIPDNSFWRYLEASVDWHVDKNITFSFGAIDNWLDRGHSAYSLKFDYAKPLNDSISAYASASVMKFNDADDLDYSQHFTAGIKYQRNRWGVDLGVVTVDSSLAEELNFDVGENHLRLSVSYRLY